MSRTDPARDYHNAGAQLDDHLRDCALCRSGHGCADGDQSADAEYRAWRQWQNTDPTSARSQQKGRPA